MRRTYKNFAEEEFCKWIEKSGYYPIKRGWPDFFCRNPKKGKVIMVEVKPTPGKYLKKEQLIVMQFLSSFGIDCFRWDPQSKYLQKINSDQAGRSQRETKRPSINKVLGEQEVKAETSTGI